MSYVQLLLLLFHKRVFGSFLSVICTEKHIVLLLNQFRQLKGPKLVAALIELQLFH